MESIRLLLLTSTLGFLSRSCYVKMLVGLIISVAFFAVFLWVRPYRRSSQNLIQAAAMLLPVVGLGYFMAGGWEAAEEQCGAVDDDVVEHDSTTLLALHAVLLAPPICMALFSVVSTVYVWREGRKRGKHRARDRQPRPPPQRPSSLRKDADEDGDAVDVDVEQSQSRDAHPADIVTERATLAQKRSRASYHVQLDDIDALIKEEQRAYAAAQQEDYQKALLALQQKLDKRAKRAHDGGDDPDGSNPSWSTWSSFSSLSDPPASDAGASGASATEDTPPSAADVASEVPEGAKDTLAAEIEQLKAAKAAEIEQLKADQAAEIEVLKAVIEAGKKKRRTSHHHHHHKKKKLSAVASAAAAFPPHKKRKRKRRRSSASHRRSSSSGGRRHSLGERLDEYRKKKRGTIRGDVLSSVGEAAQEHARGSGLTGAPGPSAGAGGGHMRAAAALHSAAAMHKWARKARIMHRLKQQQQQHNNTTTEAES